MKVASMCMKNDHVMYLWFAIDGIDSVSLLFCEFITDPSVDRDVYEKYKLFCERSRKCM